MTQTNELIIKAKEYLQIGKIDLVIGYTVGTNPDRRRPGFVTVEDEADSLVLDSRCEDNLAVYLVKEKLLANHKKVAIFLNPAGIRTVNILASEGQIDVGKIVILGFEIKGEIVKILQGESVDDFSDLISQLKQTAFASEKMTAVKEIESLSVEQRFAYWQEQFSECIKCYACRQACPMCYCNRCVVECNQPQWICTSSHTLGNFEWNIVRAFHLAGRCVDCGNCERACPIDIPLMEINRKLGKEVLERFDYFPGLSKDQQAVLTSFKQDDPQEFIL